MSQQTAVPIEKDLGGGLILRRATLQDVEAIAAFDARIHGREAFDQNGLSAWVRDLGEGKHPTMRAADFTIVEDTASGKIVSSLNLISQTWSYAGIPIKIGRPELVGTDADYRKRGLVREQFALIHEWSRQRGELAQAITGIPYYYRQFGYEMTLEMSGGWMNHASQYPNFPADQQEPFVFRPAVEADLAWLLKMEQRAQKRSLVRALRDEAHMRYELLGMRPDNINRQEFAVIETSAGRPVGMVAHPWYCWGQMQPLFTYELDEGVSYLEVTPFVLRYMWRVGEEHSKARNFVLKSVGLWLGSDHPAYHAANHLLVPDRPPFPFFMRVPDLPAFLRAVAPVLEQRLVDSPVAGFGGELILNFYRDGVRMVWEQGKLAQVESWNPLVSEADADARFPNLTFLHLLFGYRTLEDVRYMFADCWANEKATVLLNTLFPKQASSVWVIS